MDSDINPQVRKEVRCLVEMIDALKVYEDDSEAFDYIRWAFYRLTQEEAFSVLLLAVLKLHELIIPNSEIGAADVEDQSDST